jgi:general secretion pathway protein D
VLKLSTIRHGAERRLLLFAAAALLAGGCAASGALNRGKDFELRQEYDAAVAEYTQAVRQKPDDTEARLALDRAKLRASMDHFQRGRRLDATGKYEQALVEYEAAAELNPSSSEADTAVRETRNKLRTKIAVSREGKTELQSLIDRTRTLPAPGLDLPVDVKMPESLFFSGAGSRLVFMAIGKIADISVGFDPAFREASVTLDLRNTTLRDALNAVGDQTRNFYRVTAPRTVLIIPDTPAKRREYEEEVVRVFYLSNADLKETMDLLRMVLDARRISPVTGTNALTVKDTPERIDAASRLLAAIDKARPEVIIDVELLEVDRTRLQEYGLQFASPGSPGINGGVGIAPDTSTTPPTISLQTLRNLTQADVLFANLPNLYYRLLKTDSNTRTLANPQLRTMEGITAQARFGEQVPVPVTTFSPIAAGGLPIQPTTSFDYRNIGVNIDITPRTHHEDEVTLTLRVAVQAISGTGFGGLPTFANREINTQIRLRDGETNMLAGLIRDEERRVLDGIPGLSDLPVIGRIFGHNRTEINQSDIILTLTPHIIRVLDVSEDDLRAFRVGRDAASSIGGDLPPALDIPAPAPAIQPAAPAPAPPPAAPIPGPAPIIPGTTPGTPPGTTPTTTPPKL